MNLKKKLVIVCSIVMFILLGVCFLQMDDELGMQYQVMSESKFEKLTAKLNQTEELPDRLAFREEKLPYHEGEKTYYLPVNNKQKDWESGSFSMVSESEKSDAKVFFLEEFTKKDKASLVASNQTIPMIVVTKNEYMLCSLKLTGLPMLTFSSSPDIAEDGNPLFEMALYQSCDKPDWVIKALTTATIRGNTSKEYDKKSLRLKLKKRKADGTLKPLSANLLNIRTDDDWILNSLYADNSRIRDKLCMDLWKETGAYQNPYQACFGVSGEYAEVVINDGYAGLYLLSHPIDAKQVNMDRTSKQIEAGKTIIERIYKKKYTARWSAEDFTGDFPDPNLNNFRGGFFLKGDVITGDLKEWDPLYEMASCIEAEDATFASEIGQIADTENIVDNWLFFQAIGGFDNENKNIYYIARNRNQSYYGYFIPWDMNLSFGSVYADNAYYSEESMEEVNTVVAFEPGNRMLSLDVAGSRNYAADTWENWRSGVFSDEALQTRIESLQKDLITSGALKREMDRWPDGNASEDITLLKEYAHQRASFVDAYLKAWK